MLHDILSVWKSMWMMFRLLVLVWVVLTRGHELPWAVPVLWPVIVGTLLPGELG